MIRSPRPLHHFLQGDCLKRLGTEGGACKFSGEVKLALDLVPEIHAKAGDTRLVMHGSSSVPADLVAMIDEYPVVRLRHGILSVAGLWEPDMKAPETRAYRTTDARDMARLGAEFGRFSCMMKSSGVPMEHIQAAIKAGVRRINVDTDGRLGTTGAIRKYMAENPAEFDQRKYFEAARKALYDMAVEKMRGFGAVGKA